MRWGLSPEAEPAGGGGSRGLGDSPPHHGPVFSADFLLCGGKGGWGDPVPLGVH